MVGDAAIEVRVAEDGQLRLAVADADKVLVLTVRASDAKRWADSVALVVRAKAPSRRVSKEWRVMLEEPGLQAGSMTLTRRDGEVGSRWSLYLADKEFEEIRVGISPDEARALLAAVQRSVNVVLPPTPKSPGKSPRHHPVRPKSTAN